MNTRMAVETTWETMRMKAANRAIKPLLSTVPCQTFSVTWYVTSADSRALLASKRGIKIRRPAMGRVLTLCAARKQDSS